MPSSQRFCMAAASGRRSRERALRLDIQVRDRESLGRPDDAAREVVADVEPRAGQPNLFAHARLLESTEAAEHVNVPIEWCGGQQRRNLGLERLNDLVVVFGVY